MALDSACQEVFRRAYTAVCCSAGREEIWRSQCSCTGHSADARAHCVLKGILEFHVRSPTTNTSWKLPYAQHARWQKWNLRGALWSLCGFPERTRAAGLAPPKDCKHPIPLWKLVFSSQGVAALNRRWAFSGFCTQLRAHKHVALQT